VEARGTVRVSASSGRLARGVAALVRSLGGWCSVRRRSTRESYVCTIDYAEPKELVTLSSKLIALWLRAGAPADRCRHRAHARDRDALHA